MKSTFTPILLFALAMSVPLFFQNCGGAGQRDPASTALGSLETGDAAREVLKTNCAACHQDPGALAEPKQILDEQYLIANRWIIPGDPFASPLYKALFQGMPKGQTALNTKDISSIENWIHDLQAPVGSPAKLVVNEGHDVEFGTVATGQTFDQTITIKNEGGALANSITIRALNSPFSFKGGNFPGDGGTCLPVLPALATCTVVLRFSPNATNAVEKTMFFDYNDGFNLQSASLKLKGAGSGQSLASLTITESPTYAFPQTNVGLVSEKTFTVTNVGSATATSISAQALLAPFTFKGGSYPGATSGGCSTSLMMGGTCKITVVFTPTAASTTYSAQLSLSYNKGNGSANLALGLTGVGLNTGTTGVYYSQIRSILRDGTSCGTCHDTEWGNTRAQLLQFSKTGAPYAIQPIPNAATSRMIKRLNGTDLGPQMGVGGLTNASGHGTLSDANRQKIVNWILAGAPDDPVDSRAILNLSGASPLAFGSVVSGSSSDQTLTLSNVGMQAATTVSGSGLTAPFSFKGGSFPGLGGSCTSTIASAASCTVVISFAPTAATASTGTAQISYNDGSAVQTLSRAVSGTGTGVSLANLTASPSAPAFGTISVGQLGNASVTIQNVGAAQATALSVSGLAAPFKYTPNSGGTSAYPGNGGTCGTTLAAGATCKINLSYAPTASGANSGSMTVNYNNGAAAKTVAVSMTGTGLAVSGDPVYYSEVQAILTAGNCYSCHSNMGPGLNELKSFKYEGKTGNAIVPGNYSSRFITALTTGSGGYVMGKDKGSLSADDVSKLIAWIMAGAPNDPAGSVTQAFRPSIGDRYYISSVLYKVYGTSTGAQGMIDDITNRMDLFGSPCHAQDSVYIDDASATRVINVPFKDTCTSDKSENSTDAEMTPASSVVGESMRISQCMLLSSNNTLLDQALSGAGLTAGSPFDDVSIKKIFARFYAGAEPNAAQLEALKAIGEKALLAGTPIIPNTTAGRRREGWRFTVMTICNSSGWTAP